MRGMGKRVFMAAAVFLAAASLTLWVAERAGAAAGVFVQQGKLEARAAEEHRRDSVRKLRRDSIRALGKATFTCN